MAQDNARQYGKVEYTGEASTYVLLPQHKLLIPMSSNIAEQIIKELVARGDVRSTVSVSDYPTVTSVQARLWYEDYEIVEVLKVVEVFKPREAMSGYELQRKADQKRVRKGRQLQWQKLSELNDNPFYQALPKEEQYEQRRKKLTGEG